MAKTSLSAKIMWSTSLALIGLLVLAFLRIQGNFAELTIFNEMEANIALMNNLSCFADSLQGEKTARFHADYSDVNYQAAKEKTDACLASLRAIL